MSHVAKAVLSLAVLLSSSVAAAAPTLLKADEFLGSVPGVPIRDVNSGGLPWVLDKADVKLEADGTLKVNVVGLVFAPGTPAAGTVGAVTHFAVTLSCVQADGSTANVTTDGFPVTTDGDVRFKTTIEIPPVCYAPVVLIRSFNPDTLAAGAWFAVNGF
jgi:hypothetical protein